MGGY